MLIVNQAQFPQKEHKMTEDQKIILETMKQGFDVVNHTVTQRFNEIEENFDKRFNNLGGRFDTLEGRRQT